MEFFKKLDLKTLAIIILVVVIFLMRMCNGGDVNNTGDVVKVDGKKYEVIKHEIDTITVPVIQTEYRDGKTIYSEKPVYINVLAKVDTLSILKDYYAKYNYKDTLKLKDSLDPR
jgi:ribosomal protein L24